MMCLLLDVLIAHLHRVCSELCTSDYHSRVHELQKGRMGAYFCFRPYNSLQRTKLTNGSYTTVAKPVFYGQWAFQKAVAGGVSIVPVRLSRSTANVKVSVGSTFRVASFMKVYTGRVAGSTSIMPIRLGRNTVDVKVCKASTEPQHSSKRQRKQPPNVLPELCNTCQEGAMRSTAHVYHACDPQRIPCDPLSLAMHQVWALKPRSGTGLRLVIINKTGTTGQAGFSVRGLPPAQRQGRSYQLTAPAANAGSGVRFGGITAEAAAVGGSALRYNFVKGTSAGGVLQFSVNVPKYWAGLLVF